MAASIRYSGFPILDDDGLLSSGALVYVYDAGTTTKRDIFTDPALSTAADNPIVCTGGYCPQRYTGSGSYKLVVTTAAGVSLSHLNLDNIDTGVAVGSGDLPVADGGTGASTAANARTNLAAASSTALTSAVTDITTLQGRVGSTDSTTLAAGTTAQRPVSPAVGQVRWNSTTSELEAYDGSDWYNILTSESRATTAQVTSETTGKFIDADRLKYSKRAVFAWAYVTNSAGTTTLVNSLNVASVTDNGAGDTTLTFTTAFANANFAAVASTISNTVQSAVITAKTTTTVRVVTTTDAGTASDAGFCVMCIGDYT